MNKKKYKALMLDLDGTTIPNRLDGMPSKAVINAVAKASKLLHVGVVTARPFNYAKSVIESLEINGPSILTGGAQVVDVKVGTVLWQKFIPKKNLKEINEVIKGFNLTYGFDYSNDNSGFSKNPELRLEDTIAIKIPEVSFRSAEAVMEKLEKFKDVIAHKIGGVKKEKLWIQISHAEATKQHGIFEVAQILNIDTHEIIGVGDSYNDFPLLMACGLKVAMGNAVTELKEIADYIAPSVEEDGVVDVIEKFVL